MTQMNKSCTDYGAKLEPFLISVETAAHRFNLTIPPDVSNSQKEKQRCQIL